MGAEKLDSASSRGTKRLPSPNTATISAVIGLGFCLGICWMVKESGPWAGEEAGDRGLGGRRLWLPQLDSGGWVVWLEGVTQGLRTGGGQNQSSYGLYLSVSKSGGMGWSSRGKGRGNQRGSGGREVEEARSGAMLSHHPQGPEQAFGGP